MVSISESDIRELVNALVLMSILGPCLAILIFRTCDRLPDFLGDLADTVHRRFFPVHYYAWCERLFVRGEQARKRRMEARVAHIRKYRPREQ